MSFVTDLFVDESEAEAVVFLDKHLNGLVLKVMFRDFKLYRAHLKYQVLSIFPFLLILYIVIVSL